MSQHSDRDKIQIRGFTHFSESRVVYWLSIPPSARNYFGQEFLDIDFGADVRNVPDSILYVTAVGNLMFVALLTGCSLEVPTLDEQFRKSVDRIFSNVRGHFPSLNNGVELICNFGDETAPTNASQEEDTLLCFSGGLDAYTAYFSNAHRVAVGLFIRGMDISASKKSALDALNKVNSNWFASHGKRLITAEFDRHKFFNAQELDPIASFLGNDNFWGNIQYGITTASISVPVAHTMGLSRVAIASCNNEETYSIAASGLRGGAAIIYEEVKWLNGRCCLSERDMSRQDKIQKVLSPRLKGQSEFVPLRTCWYQNLEGNCGQCEKCGRTLAGLLIGGLDPKLLGFPLFNSKDLETVKKRFIEGNCTLCGANVKTWTQMQQQIPESLKQDSNLGEFFKWMAEWDFSQQSQTAAPTKRSFILRVRQRAKREIINFSSSVKNGILPVAASLKARKIRRTPRVYGEKRLLLWSTSMIDGSLGDDALLSSTVQELKAQGYQVDLALMGRKGLFVNVPGVEKRWTPFEHFYAPGLKEWIAFVDRLNEYDGLVSIGADNIDGKYSIKEARTRLQTHNLAASAGKRSLILGCSFNEEFPQNILCKDFQKLNPRIELTARDPLAFKRYQSIQSPVRLKQTADVAFMLKPKPPEDPSIKQWVDACRDGGYRVLGVNISLPPFVDNDKHSISDVIKKIAESYRKLCSSNKIALIFVAHDLRRNNKYKVSDYDLNFAVQRELSNCEFPVMAAPFDFKAENIKYLAGMLDCAISCRMHFAIACLGAGTPVACIPYQGKFEGLFEYFNKPEWIIQPEQLLRGLDLKVVEDLIQSKAYVQERLVEVKALSRMNFE